MTVGLLGPYIKVAFDIPALQALLALLPLTPAQQALLCRLLPPTLTQLQAAVSHTSACLTRVFAQIRSCAVTLRFHLRPLRHRLSSALTYSSYWILSHYTCSLQRQD